MVTWLRRAATVLAAIALLVVGVDNARVRAGGVAGTIVSGSVVDQTLAPLAKAVVTLQRGSTVVARATTDAEGKFGLGTIVPGDYQLRVELSGWAPVTRDLHIAADMPALTVPLVLGAREEAATAPAAPGTNVGGQAKGQQLPGLGGGLQAVGSGAADATRGGGGGRGGSPATVSAMPALPPPPQYAPGQAPAVFRSGYMAPPPVYWPPYETGETYAPIEPNGFMPAREHPLSTFGADVDTASYSNIRRFLAAGQLPPPDAVRIEELVNYFHFDYPAPRDGRPISLTTEIGACPWAPAHRLVLIGARAAAPREREVTGRNIVLLIDVSGSMQPAERLPLIKTAFGLFVDTLRPDDTVSIVTYAGTSGVALWPTPVRRREVIQAAIANLSAGGSTNGGEGLITAYRVARQAFIPGGVNRVILATDGDFNVGLTSPTGLLHLIESQRDSGIFLSVFGVGSGNLKDQTMELLADHGNGHYAYLDSLQEARRVLIHEADQTLETVAKDVKFQVEFNPATVAAWRLLGYEKREMAARDFNNDRKGGGEVTAGHTVTVLYEVVPVGVGWDESGETRPAVDPLKYQQSPAVERPVQTGVPSGEWFTVKARYKLPEGDTSDEIAMSARPGGRVSALPLASAVAEFGLLLRDGPYEPARWAALLGRIDRLEVPPAQVADRDGFKELVATAAGLARLR